MKRGCDVRVLGSGDVASLRAMLAMFGRAFGEVATYTSRQPDDAYLARLLASDTFVAIVAFVAASAGSVCLAILCWCVSFEALNEDDPR